MKFSVLMSVYYQEQPAHLKEALDSVFDQTLPPDEVVLVEDGPLTPELERIIKGEQILHPALKRVSLKQNVGLGLALREGLSHCSNDLVARMDTDDICKRERFERQTRFMEEHPDIDVLGTWIDEFVGCRRRLCRCAGCPRSTTTSSASDISVIPSTIPR